MEFEIVLLAVMIAFSAFFSGIEISLFSLSPAQVRSLVERKVRGSQIVARLKANPERLLGVILIGNNIVNIGSASLATSVAIRLVGDAGVGLATGVMTLLILIFGEVSPKTFAVRHAEAIALKAARFLELIGIMLFPFAWLLERLANVVNRLAGPRKSSAEEHKLILMSLARMGLEEGKIQVHQHRILENAFRLDQTPAERIMTPRNAIVALLAGTTLLKAVEEIASKPYSRFPVLLDEKQGIIGILHVRDLHEQIRLGRGKIRVEEVAAKPIFVPSTMPLSELLFTFQRERMHMAVILDEYGDTDGIVTLEDVLEELVGDIEDEVDVARDSITRISEGHYLVQASISLDDLNRALATKLPAGQHNTLNGLLLDLFQDIPKPKDRIGFEGHTFIIRQADARHVILVELALAPPKTEN